MPRNVWYSVGRAAIAAYARAMMSLDVVDGHDDIPRGAKLIVANHPSSTDPFLLPLVFRHPIDMLLIGSAFTIPLVGAYLRRADQVCVTRDGSAFAEARRRLEAGRSVALFPEGNVTPVDGSALAPRTGAARLALSTGVPVVPIGIHFPRERLRHVRTAIRNRPMNGHWYLRGPYAITVGQPMRFDGRGDDEAHVALTTSAIMDCIAALSRDSEQRLRSTKRH